MILFNYSTSREQKVLSRLLAGYRGYLMTDDYSGYNAIKQLAGVERLGCRAHARRKFVDAQKVQSKGKTGRADVALLMINALYKIERDQKKLQVSEAELHRVRAEQSAPILKKLHEWLGNPSLM